MEREMRERILTLFRLVRREPKYASLCKEYERLLDQFEQLVNELPEEDQDIIWGFVCVSEEMNWRMLEWLCEKYGIEA